MRNFASDRRGFTLIEVLVTLILLAVLAAAVFPVVSQQAADADPVKGAQDLSSIRTGIETFNLNIRKAYPGDLEDLATQISTADNVIVRASQSGGYGTSDSIRWNGPYIDASVVDGGGVNTAFGVLINDNLTRYDADNDVPSGRPSFQSTGALFVAATIGTSTSHLSAAQFEALNDLIDGEVEVDGPGAATSWTQGKLRFNNKVTASDSIAYYLAVPIAK